MPTLAQNPLYLEYERLLREVHRLIASGEGDSARADVLREAMDTPATQLSPAEMARLDGLSADLYMLQGREVPASDWGKWTPDRLRRDLQYAVQWNDWTTLLHVLRKNSTRILSLEQIAYFRYRAYKELGHSGVAYDFLGYAIGLNPKEAYRFLELDLLRDFDFPKALSLASHYINSDNVPFSILTMSAGILHHSTKQLTEEASRPIYQRIAAVLSAAMPNVRTDRRILPTVLAHGYLTLGLALDGLGQTDAAIAAYDAALAAQPDDQAILTARGILKASLGARDAFEDFAKAIQQGARTVVPYFYAAIAALRGGDYGRLFALIESIRDLTADPRITAVTYEWAAIASAESGQDPSVIRRLFTTATELDPQNPTIRKNFATFEASIKGQPLVQVPLRGWSVEDETIDLHEARAELGHLHVPAGLVTA